jgi:hypothetical protein
VRDGRLILSAAQRGSVPAGLFGTVQRDGGDAALTEAGGKLVAARMAFRPQLQDLYLRLDLQTMPTVALANPAIVYGVDLTVDGARYEVRAAGVGPLVASFGLFRRTTGGVWTKVADLHGGYGTTGQQVVFALPLRAIAAQNGTQISAVTAFTALGSYYAGAAHLLDQIELNR